VKSPLTTEGHAWQNPPERGEHRLFLQTGICHPRSDQGPRGQDFLPPLNLGARRLSNSSFPFPFKTLSIEKERMAFRISIWRSRQAWLRRLTFLMRGRFRNTIRPRQSLLSPPCAHVLWVQQNLPCVTDMCAGVTAGSPLHRTLTKSFSGFLLLGFVCAIWSAACRN
jgi:hypothetical protein